MIALSRSYVESNYLSCLSLTKNFIITTVGDTVISHFVSDFHCILEVLFTCFIQESFCSTYAQSLAKDVVRVFFFFQLTFSDWALFIQTQPLSF